MDVKNFWTAVFNQILLLLKEVLLRFRENLDAVYLTFNVFYNQLFLIWTCILSLYYLNKPYQFEPFQIYLLLSVIFIPQPIRSLQFQSAISPPTCHHLLSLLLVTFSHISSSPRLKRKIVTHPFKRKEIRIGLINIEDSQQLPCK